MVYNDLVCLFSHTSPLQSLDATLLAQGRKLHTIKGDGNCLFRALAFIISGSEDAHEDMRKRIVDFEEKHKVLGVSEEYIQKMRKSEWGSDVELRAVASLYQKNVYVFTQSGSTQYMWKKPYTPEKLTDVKITFTKVTHLELCHTNNNHFDCIVDEKGDFSSECPFLPNSVSHFN